MFPLKLIGKLKAKIGKLKKGVIWQLMNVVNVECQLTQLAENVTPH